MNNKGQFSIIAALLVAVVLISTVIITYSTIRNSSIHDQPQVLSAIDETNFAIKQILGFTVGYYCSVLQVTGNSSYARMLAINYLDSGLMNIANMHPEWGASFSVNDSNTELHTYWFTNTSYSTGNLVITYNLTGLGIYGITYENSCRLTVQVKSIVSNNQTQLTVMKDEGEPLISLRKQNFKFYLYRYTNLTWELMIPDMEPIAFANGTYIIDIPSGIDPHSYVIQVEDQRGLIVVASSFNYYISTLTWNSTEWTKNYVDNNTSDVDFSGDKGTHSHFPAQQYGPDAIYDTLTEENTGGGEVNYELDLEVQWTGVDYNETNEELCIYGGTMGSENITVSVWNGTIWKSLFTALSSGWNNVSVSSYLDSPTFTIRFKGSNESLDTIQDNWKIDSTFLHIWPTEDLYSSLQDATIIVELLQNGTMRWLGQNLQLTTQAKPFPPIPVKAIHLNQTINNVTREVPFQIEDWASNYRIPLGLTSNASVFNSRTMLVFLVNPNVSKVTIWWDGDDTAIQTPYAYVNQHFTVDTVQRTLNNSILNLEINFSTQAGVDSFKIISTVGTSTNTAEFMRINDEVADYGDSEPTYAIANGTVRAVIHHEVEWDSGATDCPNVYAHIVLTLPANATYYTYQLRFMFIESQRNRTITDLCPIRITAPTGQPQTENGTSDGYPIISNTTGLFYNLSTSSWAHHWSQFVSGTKGAGVMFTNSANQKLYFFDTIAGNTTGALKVSNSTDETIELLPVTMAQVNFTSALDISWHGAVVTFDGTTPIYIEEDGRRTGLWIIVEYPPTITVTTEN